MVIKKTRQEYIHDLELLQNRVAAMGDTAAVAVDNAMHALLQGDRKLAEQVMKADDRIDEMLIDVEDECLLLIAKQQPIAHDLRLIATAFKVSTDIERIGDHAFDIAKVSLGLSAASDPEWLTSIGKLGEHAEQMLVQAVAAYRQNDVSMANKVRKLDQEMDRQFADTFYSLSRLVTNDAQRQQCITQLLFVARYLERIGDHAVNIAEWIIYLETAKRIYTQKHSQSVE